MDYFRSEIMQLWKSIQSDVCAVVILTGSKDTPEGRACSWAKSCLSAGIRQKCSSVTADWQLKHRQSLWSANLHGVTAGKIFQIKRFPSYLHPNLYSKWFVNKAASQRETAKDSNCLNYFKWYISGLLKCSKFFLIYVSLWTRHSNNKKNLIKDYCIPL